MLFGQKTGRAFYPETNEMQGLDGLHHPNHSTSPPHHMLQFVITNGPSNSVNGASMIAGRFQTRDLVCISRFGCFDSFPVRFLDFDRKSSQATLLEG